MEHTYVGLDTSVIIWQLNPGRFPPQEGPVPCSLGDSIVLVTSRKACLSLKDLLFHVQGLCREGPAS